MKIEQIKIMTQHGDYTLLGKILGINVPAAKMRFLRGNEKAKQALIMIIENREELIREFQKDENINKPSLE